MSCTPCGARRKKVVKALKDRDLTETVKQVATGTVELLGLKDKTGHLDETPPTRE